MIADNNEQATANQSFPAQFKINWFFTLSEFIE